VTEDQGGVDDAAKAGNLSIRIGLGWAKSHVFSTGQCPVMRYNRQLMHAILYEKFHPAKAVNVTVISLDEAPQGYKISIRAQRRSSSSILTRWWRSGRKDLWVPKIQNALQGHCCNQAWEKRNSLKKSTSTAAIARSETYDAGCQEVCRGQAPVRPLLVVSC
jgi:hypothetical protein